VDEQLLRLGMLAERCFPDDPNTTLLKLRQLAELLAQLVATQVGLYQSPDDPQYDLLRRLQDQGILPREIAQLFGEVKRAGNAASQVVYLQPAANSRRLKTRKCRMRNASKKYMLQHQ
jgi:type I restriction enzyme R subunit